MIAQVLLEGLILGILLMGVCAFGIRKGAVGMVQEISGQASGSCLCNGQMAVRKIYDETGDGKQSFGAYGPGAGIFRFCFLIIASRLSPPFAIYFTNQMYRLKTNFP